MSSQPEDGWHGGSGSGDGQAPPAGNAAGDAVFPNPMVPIQGAEGVLPATAPTQRTSGAMGPLQLRRRTRAELVDTTAFSAGMSSDPTGRKREFARISTDVTGLVCPAFPETAFF